MTTKLSIITTGLTLLLIGCTKNQSPKGSTSDLVIQAKTFFEKNVASAGKSPITANYRANQPRTVQWQAATVQHSSGGDAVTVPISYHDNLYITKRNFQPFLIQCRETPDAIPTQPKPFLTHLLPKLHTYQEVCEPFFVCS